MKIVKIITLMVSVILLNCTAVLWSQMLDYNKPETPSPSWNGIFLYDARMAASGGVALMSSGAGTAIANPAIAPKENGFYINSSAAILGQTAYQYGALNSGVFYTEDPLFELNANFSNLSAVLSTEKINLSAGWYRHASLELPDYTSSQQQYIYEASYTGAEDAVFFAVSGELFQDFCVGAKFTYLYGSRSAEQDENYNFAVISQYEHYEFRYYMISLGMLFKPAKTLSIAALMDYPFGGDVDEQISITFDARELNGAYIYKTNTGKSDFERPPKINLSISYSPTGSEGAEAESDLTIAVEFNYILWSDYTFYSFGEEIERYLEDAFVAAVGIEKKIEFETLDLFLRGGYRLDPQPTTDPTATLHWLTLGAGLAFSDLTIDMAGAYIFGSLNEWTANNFTVVTTLGYKF